jgi:hypothetical protein
MSRSTIRDFPSETGIGPVVESWASNHGFVLVGTEPDGTRTYVNDRVVTGGATPVAAELAQALANRTKTLRIVRINQVGSQVHIEAWLRFSKGLRAMTLFLVPEQMGIEGGGFAQRMERWETRQMVNPLLVQLGQPPIK